MSREVFLPLWIAIMKEKLITCEEALKIAQDMGTGITTITTIQNWAKKFDIGEKVNFKSIGKKSTGRPDRWMIDKSKLVALIKESGY